MSTKLTILKGFLLEDMFHWLIFIVDFLVPCSSLHYIQSNLCCYRFSSSWRWHSVCVDSGE